MQANTVQSVTKQSSTLNRHPSCGELVSGTCFNVTPEGSALSTGGALLETEVKMFLWISRPVCDLLFVHPWV